MNIPTEIMGGVVAAMLALQGWILSSLLSLRVQVTIMSARIRFLELQHRKGGLGLKGDTDFLKGNTR